MKILFLSLLLALSLLSKGFGQDLQEFDRRMEAANLWLMPLCVVNADDFVQITPRLLAAKFDSWLVGSTKEGRCERRSSAAYEGVPQPKSHEDERLKIKFSDLFPGAWGRIARMTEFRLDVQQTPSYVFGVKEGAPITTASAFIPNPDHVIYSFGGPLHLEELFVDSQVRTAACTAWKDSGHKVGPKDECGKIDYIFATRNSDRVLRVGTAMAVTLKFSDVPRFESGIVASTSYDLFAKHAKSISGTFDPSKLFRSTSEWKALGEYAKAELARKSGGISENSLRNSLPCDFDKLDSSACLKNMVLGSRFQRATLFFLPQISVTSSTPFDLAKNGTSFAVPPNDLNHFYGGHTLYAVGLSWNLHGQIASAAQRVDTYKALVQIRGAQKPTNLEQVNALQVWRMRVRNSYIDLKLFPEKIMDDRWWQDFEALMIGSRNDPHSEEMKFEVASFDAQRNDTAH